MLRMLEIFTVENVLALVLYALVLYTAIFVSRLILLTNRPADLTRFHRLRGLTSQESAKLDDRLKSTNSKFVMALFVFVLSAIWVLVTGIVFADLLKAGAGSIVFLLSGYLATNFIDLRNALQQDINEGVYVIEGEVLKTFAPNYLGVIRWSPVLKIGDQEIPFSAFSIVNSGQNYRLEFSRNSGKIWKIENTKE